MTLRVMITVSFEPGPKFGVQFVALSQSPLVGLVHVKVMGVKRA
jgi:hypothetical protein